MGDGKFNFESIAQSLVDFPEYVKVEAIEDEGQFIYDLSVHSDDIGKVIGKNGRIAKAIRTIVYAAAGLQQQKKVYLEIDD